MKTVPSIWFKEMANEYASQCIEKGAKHGIKSKEYLEAKKKRESFKSKFKPSNIIKDGNLPAAKNFILSKVEKIKKITSISDKNDPYNLIGLCSDRFFLSNKQVNQLMNFMSKKGLLY